MRTPQQDSSREATRSKSRQQRSRRRSYSGATAVGGGQILLGLSAPQLGPILQALLDLALEAAIDGTIEDLPRQIVRKIVLPRKALGRVGIIDIALAIAEIAHEPCRRVDAVHRRHERAALLGGAL